VLDFGLAKLAPSSDVAVQTAVLSHAGIVMGTAAYMSPEQARGKPVDKRTDIWALGCVLYEMLARRAAFAGPTVSDTIAAIIEREPDWSVLPTAVPSRIRELLQLCLVKDVRKRRQDIGDVRLDIERAMDA
jgi:serine/threonine protein kinase